MYGTDADSVFTDDSHSDGGLRLGDSVSVVNGGGSGVGRLPLPPSQQQRRRHQHQQQQQLLHHRSLSHQPVVPMPMPPTEAPARGAGVQWGVQQHHQHPRLLLQGRQGRRERILSDPEISSHFREESVAMHAATSSPASPLKGAPAAEYVNLGTRQQQQQQEEDDDEDEEGGLYVNQSDLRDSGVGYRYAYAGSPPAGSQQMEEQRSLAASHKTRRALFQSQNSISGERKARQKVRHTVVFPCSSFSTLLILI